VSEFTGGSNNLYIMGSSADGVNFAGTWSAGDAVIHDGIAYNPYTSASSPDITVLIQQSVSIF